MAQRKEVFQSKVLQKLYPATPKSEEPTSAHFVEALAEKTHKKRKDSRKDAAFGDARKTQSAAGPGRRIYTVLPPPADYNIQSEESFMLPQLESINSADKPAEESICQSSEEVDEENGTEQPKKRKRRRKRKPAVHQETGRDVGALVGESSTGQSETPVDEGEGRISANKKRKLKKKRRKEKLLSMGLMPRATALEFTYQKDEDDEEEDERKAAEVSDFLRTTMEIYMSDSSLRSPHMAATVDDLLSSIASGDKPNSVLKQLYSLKAFVQQNETERLEKALKDLESSSSMSAEETTAVVSLFQYWITDILSMQGDKKTNLCTTHP